MVLKGNELRFYRKEGDVDHKVMHCIAGTYLKDITMEEVSLKSRASAAKSMVPSSKNSQAASAEESKKKSNKNFYPVKLVIPPNKSRLIFFARSSEQSNWI